MIGRRAAAALLALAAPAGLLGAAGCRSEAAAFDGPVSLGGVSVPAHTLERGRQLYGRLCASCHGDDGAALTPLARQLEPPPRAFRDGRYPRATGGAERLPTDAELARIVTGGLPGTGMPAWTQLTADDVAAVVHYLKTFSPRWAAGPEAATKPLPPTGGPDTVRARRAGGAGADAVHTASAEPYPEAKRLPRSTEPMPKVD